MTCSHNNIRAKSSCGEVSVVDDSSVSPKMSLEAIRYVSDGPQNDGKATTKNSLEILDQLLLPDSTVYLDIKSVEDGWNGIRNMNVSGLSNNEQFCFLLQCVPRIFPGPRSPSYCHRGVLEPLGGDHLPTG